jgi:signal transduction histidine kinase
MMRPFQLTRPLQIAFLVLLVVCTAQVTWWILDQFAYTHEVRSRIHALYLAESQAAQVMLRSGRTWTEVRRVYPHLALDADSATVRVAPGAMAELDHERFHRLNRYVWEGGFFLVVLVGAMAVVYRTLHEEAVLRRRQEAFLAAVSHELRSPLASLRLSAETLAMRDPPVARRAELLARLLADLSRLDRTIGNILDASRLAAASVRTAPEPLGLRAEVAAVAEELREHALECNVTLRVDVSPDLAVRADPEGLRTVLRNLLLNAIRATCRTKGTVTVQATRRDRLVRVAVMDDGDGFPPAEATRLFEKFYRVEDAKRERPCGTGLGLYLVRRLVELDGGQVAASSEGPGRGARFVVNWPAAEDVA